MKTENIFRVLGCLVLTALVSFAVLSGTAAKETTPNVKIEAKAEVISEGIDA